MSAVMILECNVTGWFLIGNLHIKMNEPGAQDPFTVIYRDKFSFFSRKRSLPT